MHGNVENSLFLVIILTHKSPAKAQQIETGGNHDELLEEMEELFTTPDVVLSIMEKHLPPYEAKVLLCQAFQVRLD